MALATGTNLGPYQILSPLGVGGMGEVYRARDTRLDRTVAIKVLPSRSSSDAGLQKRFEREARAISALQHPHICVLHDIGSENGTSYLVMEYLEGQTLADRLRRGPLPLPEVLKVAGEIAQALDKAHQQGVIHRDLKPANIMLTRAGAKLMDFGLAKMAAGELGTDISAAATQSRASNPLTTEGSIVGTFQYMAPEVLEGEEADSRSDIFSFGCVLYEMLTGRRAFDGKTRASVIAAIMEREPEPVAALQPLVPASLDRMVGACLAKQRDQRWNSAHDLCIELGWVATEKLQAGAHKPTSTAHLLWLIAAALAIVVVLLAALQFRAKPATAAVVRSWLVPPPGYSFAPYNFAISPDGKRFAFVASAQGKPPSLWVRTMSAPDAQQISGSENAQYPFWSPDSGRVAFFAGGKIKTVDLGSGEVRLVCPAPFGNAGGTWNADDVIVFAPGPVSVLQRVSASGGTPVPVTQLPRPRSGQAHRWPFFLPDGKHFLYFADWSDPEDPQGNGLYVGSLDGTAGKLISADITGNVEYSEGHLLYFRDRSIVAQPFDAEHLVFTGQPMVVAEQGVERHVAFSKAGFSSSRTGTLIFQSAADSAARLVWFDVKGNQLSELPGAGNRDPRLSPDGRSVAVTSDEAGNGRTNIRVYDLQRGVGTTITSSGNDEFPVWSPDGHFIYYASHDGKNFSINRVAADSSSAPEVWMQGPKMIPNSFTPDGRFLAVMNLGHGGGARIDIVSTPDHKTVESFYGAESQFSRDGRWIAYTFKGGELVVQSFPGPGRLIHISNGGGAQPRWSRDGKRLYYVAPDKKLMVVSFDPAGKLPPGSPVPVMQTRIFASHFVYIQYDITPDDKRFLIDSLPSGGGGPLALVSNWPALPK